MEEPVKEQPSASASAGNSVSGRPKLQRYALRSSGKSREQQPDAAPDHSVSSESNTKRGRITPSVSKSVGVLDFSGKDKSGSAKPPRRLSIPAKSFATPTPKVVGNITPISESRVRRSSNNDSQVTRGRSQTPSSDISRTSSRVKFNLLTSVSYWVNQIKLSESVAKHSVSLGFFKLALEAGCEPFQRMQDELKSYVCRNQLAEFGEQVKELFESYNIAENIPEQPQQVSQTISQLPEEEGTRSSDDEVNCYSSSATAAGKLKPKCLNTESTQLTAVKSATESTKKETTLKGTSGSRLRESLRVYSANSKPAVTCGNRRSVQKSGKPSNQETPKENGKFKKQGKKSDVKEVPSNAEDNRVNKENVDVQSNDEISLTEVA